MSQTITLEQIKEIILENQDEKVALDTLSDE